MYLILKHDLIHPYLDKSRAVFHLASRSRPRAHPRLMLPLDGCHDVVPVALIIQTHPERRNRFALIDPTATVLPEPRKGVGELCRLRLRPFRGVVRAGALHIAALVFVFYLGHR